MTVRGHTFKIISTMKIYENINRLTSYALTTGLIDKEDVIYTKNRLLELFQLEGFENDEEASALPPVEVTDLETILRELMDWAGQNKIFEDEGIAYRDLFDTKIMGCLVPPPSVVISKFNSLYEKNPKEATDWYYKFSQDTDYIRRYRVCKDLKWQTKTEYGDIDITINLSKPEKDPKAIAAALKAKKGGYPACLLCKENVGYAGRLNHAARQTHRIIPITLGGKTFGLQYSPYVYYNEHCIVFSYEHTPMKISRDTFVYLLDFIKLFPHYTVGSNADLPIVGGSILTHNHFQGGNYEFAMARAPADSTFTVKGFEDVDCAIVKWPMSVIRLDSKSPEKIIDLSAKILHAWRGYSDKEAFIFAETDGNPHNTITPIARKRGDLYEMDLVLRNNITTEENPLGVFHPHAELHHIKKENIGLIEVMGLAVLPSRLKKELADLADAIVNKKDLASDAELSKHADWVKEFLPKYPEVNSSNIEKILQDEVGIVFAKVLEDAGVYKRTPEGKAAFNRFIDSIKG